MSTHQQDQNRQTPELSNPASRLYQRQAIKTSYSRAKRRRNAETGSVAETARRIENAAEKAAAYVCEHKKGLLIVFAIGVAIAMMLSLVSSCTMLLQGGSSVLTASTYPSADADMLSAEADYTAMEAELQATLDGYAAHHSYDEYVFQLDPIQHDPYVLISMLTAIRHGAWTQAEVQTLLQEIFERQYTLTEAVTTEVRYRTNEDNEQEAYDYTICTVTLSNFNLSHLPVYMMNEDELGMYATYMAVLGNRPDLFPSSGYVSLYIDGSYTDYDIPAEALSDERFAVMIREAEKYLGYPYVWGGSNPATSFDCSGFVSWVINHSGWSVGRLSAQGLCNICTPTNAPQPGDLVFFKGTYNTSEVSHVGIYVGGGMMIHCGDPISYTNLNNSYWQQHLYRYGRLP